MASVRLMTIIVVQTTSVFVKINLVEMQNVEQMVVVCHVGHVPQVKYVLGKNVARLIVMIRLVDRMVVGGNVGQIAQKMQLVMTNVFVIEVGQEWIVQFLCRDQYVAILLLL